MQLKYLILNFKIIIDMKHKEYSDQFSYLLTKV